MFSFNSTISFSNSSPLALLNSAVATNGTILLSGLLIEDEKDILKAVKTFNWKHQKTITKGAWIAMYFTL